MFIQKVASRINLEPGSPGIRSSSGTSGHVYPFAEYRIIPEYLLW